MSDKKDTTAAPAKDAAPAKPAAPAFVPEVIKHVTLPILKKADDVPAFVAFQGEMFVGKEIQGTGDKAKMEPATLANVVNLETGELMQMICNKVIESTLNEEYPGGAYVGKAFSITQYSVEGKRYKNYRILEIKNPLAS